MGHGRSRIIQFTQKTIRKCDMYIYMILKLLPPPGSLENPFKADGILLEAMYVPTCKYI